MATNIRPVSSSTIEIVRANSAETHELNIAIGQWVSAHIFGRDDQFEKFTSIGFMRNGNPIAGVVFTNWLPQYGVVEISAASTDKKWLNRETVNAIFDEAFHVKQCQQLMARVAEGAAHARIFEALGFQSQLLRNMRGRDKNEILLTITGEEWSSGKWKLKNEQAKDTRSLSDSSGANRAERSYGSD